MSDRARQTQKAAEALLDAADAADVKPQLDTLLVKPAVAPLPVQNAMTIFKQFAWFVGAVAAIFVSVRLYRWWYATPATAMPSVTTADVPQLLQRLTQQTTEADRILKAFAAHVPQ